MSLKTDDPVEATARLNNLWKRASAEHFGRVFAEPTDRVYFIHDKHQAMVKVGVTRGDVYRRYINLQTGSVNNLDLIGSVSGGPDIEKVLHRFLTPHHVRREWYHAPEPVLVFIRALIGLNGSEPVTKIVACGLGASAGAQPQC